MSGDSGNIYGRRGRGEIRALRPQSFAELKQERVESARRKLVRGRNVSVRKEMERWADEHLDKRENGDKIERKTVVKVGGREIAVTKNTISETWSHNKYNERFPELMNELKEFKTWMPKMELVNGKERQRHKGNTTFSVYEIKRPSGRIVVKHKNVRNPILYIMFYK